MHFSNSFEKLVPKITDKNFKSCALEVFNFQAEHNSIYSEYLGYLRVDPRQIDQVSEIPFLPIEFFKNHEIKTGEWVAEKCFLSSGTTGSVRSCHHIRDVAFYHTLSALGFHHFYGNIEDYMIVALLPSYQAQGDSSLVAMVDHFIWRSRHPGSGYVQANQAGQKLEAAFLRGDRVLLIGVAYALLELSIDGFVPDDFLVMETGGMKGMRKEITRSALHLILKEKFRVDRIHSEYGMTELLSQAYAQHDGLFHCPPWMRVFTRDINDPFKMVSYPKTGGINVVDLANVHTCAFIETGDLGRVYPDGTFEVLGRLDNAEVRGCNLLMV